MIPQALASFSLPSMTTVLHVTGQLYDGDAGVVCSGTSPCVGAATCTDVAFNLGTTFLCTCPPDFEGRKCDIPCSIRHPGPFI